MFAFHDQTIEIEIKGLSCNIIPDSYPLSERFRTFPICQPLQGAIHNILSTSRLSNMTTWFDLPPEVKQMIFSLVTDVDSIIYVPKDRRRKVDVRYMKAQHFHDLLLVSKTFITADEFAFAVLSAAKMTFYSYNEIRRLVAEVPLSFKENIRDIHLSRTYTLQSRKCTDTFDGFSRIAETLSIHMPQLRRIYISWPGFCSQVASCRMPDRYGGEAQEQTCFSLIETILAEKPREVTTECTIQPGTPFSQVAASFLGDYSGHNFRRTWKRPLAWIRRLICYAESNGIEVILQLKMCIGYNYQNPHLYYGRAAMHRSTCWSQNLYGDIDVVDVWQRHVDAEMSTKDYMLRVEHDGRNYAYHQTFPYDLLRSLSKKDSDN